MSGTPISGTAVPGNYVGGNPGSYALWAKVNTGSPEFKITLTQTATDLVPGTLYDVGLRYNMLGALGTYPVNSATGIFIDVPPGPPQFTATWMGTGSGSGAISTLQLYAFSNTMTVTFQLSGSTAQQLAGFSIDELILRPVPEPSCGALVATCGVLCAVSLRRRRGCGPASG